MSEQKQETPPQRIWLSRSSLSQALKEGVGSYYPNFSGDPLPFALVEYIPATELARVRREAWTQALKVAEYQFDTTGSPSMMLLSMRKAAEVDLGRDESEKQ